jgi:hypothetical protein
MELKVQNSKYRGYLNLEDKLASLFELDTRLR